MYFWLRVNFQQRRSLIHTSTLFMTCIQSVILGFPHPETNLHATMPYLSISRKLRRIFFTFFSFFLSFFFLPWWSAGAPASQSNSTAGVTAKSKGKTRIVIVFFTDQLHRQKCHESCNGLIVVSVGCSINTELSFLSHSFHSVSNKKKKNKK